MSTSHARMSMFVAYTAAKISLWQNTWMPEDALVFVLSLFAEPVLVSCVSVAREGAVSVIASASSANDFVSSQLSKCVVAIDSMPGIFFVKKFHTLR